MFPSYSGAEPNQAAQAPASSVSLAETTISATKSVKGRGRNHLNKAGQSILDEYWDKHIGVMPTAEIRHTLVSQIKQCGNDFYSINNITSWFRRRLTAFRGQDSSTYPSLTKYALEHLEVLMRGTSNPSPDIVKTWASLLAPTGARYEDVVDWVRFQLNQAQPTTRLPTPANTVTPEPSIPPSSPRFNINGNPDANVTVKQSPIASPIALSAKSPNLLSNAYPSISLNRVPEQRLATQMLPVSSRTDVNSNTFAHHRQRSASWDVSPVQLASPASSTSHTPPASATQPNHRYTPFSRWPPEPESPLVSAPPTPLTSLSTLPHPIPQGPDQNQLGSYHNTPAPPPPPSRTPIPEGHVGSLSNSGTNSAVPRAASRTPIPRDHVRTPSNSYPLPPPLPPPTRSPLSYQSPALAPVSVARASPALGPVRAFSPAQTQQHQMKPKQEHVEHLPKPRNPVLQAIIEGFAEAPANPPKPSGVLPSSAAEYKAMFANYEKQLNHIRQVLEK